MTKNTVNAYEHDSKNLRKSGVELFDRGFLRRQILRTLRSDASTAATNVFTERRAGAGSIPLHQLKWRENSTEPIVLVFHEPEHVRCIRVVLSQERMDIVLQSHNLGIN